MTIDELRSKVPPSMAPWVDEYGPAIVAMTAAEMAAWLDRLVKGDVFAAYKAILAKMPNAELLAEWNTVNADWQAANDRNAERLKLRDAAVSALLRVLLGLALVSVGL